MKEILQLDTKEIRDLKRDYYEQLYTNKLVSQEKIDKSYNPPRPNNKET